MLEKYDKPVNRIISTHAKQIKQINPINKQIIIFNSLNEIYIKLGHASKSIKDAIENKTMLGGCTWEYYKKEDSDSLENDSDNVSENEDESESESESCKKPKKKQTKQNK